MGHEASIFRTERKLGLAFTLPIFILIFLLMGFPFAYTIYLSLTNKTVGMPATFVGLANYISIFTDPTYWRIVGNTVIYTVICIVVKLVLGMLFALLLNEKFHGRAITRVAMLLPWAIPGMVAANTWKWMYNDQYGIINEILRDLHLISTPIPWLGSMNLALFSVIIVNIWRGVPFFLFSILGALQSIDDQLYDAGKIDGANVFQRFFNIVLGFQFVRFFLANDGVYIAESHHYDRRSSGFAGVSKVYFKTTEMLRIFFYMVANKKVFLPL